MTGTLPAVPGGTQTDVCQWMTAKGEVIRYTPVDVVRDNHLDMGFLVSLAMGIPTLPVPNVAQADWMTTNGTIINHVGVSAACDNHVGMATFLGRLMSGVLPLPVPDVTSIERRSSGAVEGTIVHRISVGDVCAKHEGMVTFLSKLEPNVLIDEKALAKGFGLKCVRTIQRWTDEGHLPPALPMPGKYRLVGAILDWLRAIAEMPPHD